MIEVVMLHTLLAYHHAVDHLVQERLVTAGADTGGRGHGLHLGLG
jgi:hypothetical protein